MQLIFASAVLPEEEGSAGEEQLSFSFDDAGGLKPDETEESEVFAAAGMGLCLGEKEIYCIRTGKEISSKDLIREAKKNLRRFSSGVGSGFKGYASCAGTGRFSTCL